MKLQRKHSQTPVCRIAALLLVAVLLFGSIALLASADDRVTITRLEWQNTDNLVYGDAKSASVVAYDADGNAYYNIYRVKYPAGYGNVNDDGYTLTAVLTNPSFAEAEGLEHTKNVVIAPKEYGVFMESKTVAGDGATMYMIPVVGVDDRGAEMPFDVRALITYSVKGKAFNGTSEFGTYEIVATLPTGNYVFYSNEVRVNQMSATLTINREMDIVDVMNKEGKSQFVVFLTADLDENGNKVGLSSSVSATATVAENVKMPSGTKYAQALQIQMVGAAEDEKFSVLVPLTEIVYHAGCRTIDPKTSVYVYDENGEPVTAKSLGYATSASRGYIKISNIPASVGTLTISIAPEYSAGGLPLGWLIFIIILIIILLLILLFFVGRWVFKKNRLGETNEEPKEEEPKEEEAVEAFAPVAVAEESEEEEETAPNLRGLVYVDVVKNPEEYGMMLMKEKAGEGVVVYRYRKSYLAKLALADGKIGEYYSTVKNALLRFKGVKARKSWNYEAFNQGRNQIAKVIPNGKTLYLYLAIDPKTLEGTKYGAIDVSEKKKFEVTPSLMKIRGDRKLKFALELIEKVCGEQLGLKPTDKPDENYKPANQTAEKLFDSGLIRKMAALAPLPKEGE